MRFSSYINNQKCLEWGLNANQGALFDLLNQSASWATEIIIDNVVYYWVSRNEVIKELPLFYSKPDTVYRHFVALNEKKLIEYRKQGDKDLIRLTAKGKTWNEFNSDLNPNNTAEFGNKSELTRKQIRKNSDLNPTNNNTNYKNTNDHNTTLTSCINAQASEPEKTPVPSKKKSAALELLAEFGITGSLAEDFITHRKACKAPITRTALNGYQREADKAKIPIGGNCD